MKIGIAGSGGGLSCAYTAGGILALVEKYGITSPHIMVASSGSVGTFAYTISEQYESIRNIWCNLLASPKFVSFWRLHRVADIDYVVDQIFKIQDPLDIRAVIKSPTKLDIAVTNTNGGLEYFSNHDDVDLWEVMRASKAMPFLYRKKVAIGRNLYIDGAINGTASQNTKQAIQGGAELVVAFDTENESRIVDWVIGRKTKESSILENENVLTFRPKVFFAKTLDNKRENLKLMFESGYRDVSESKILLAHLS